MVIRRRYLVVLFALLVIILGVQGIALLGDDDFSRDTDTEWKVMSELNRWRLHSGLGPLMRNPDLDAMAMLQAEYVSPMVPFTGEVDFHTDAWGDGVAGRAVLYGWPGYEDDLNKVLISEIAAYFPTVNGALRFWQNSPPHHDAVETAGFREVGVAVLRRGDWLLTYAVLGGRPDVMPVMYDPARDILYLTTDKSYNAEPFDPLFVRITDKQDRALHQDDWLVWSDRVHLPHGIPNDLIVTVSDGIRDITTEIDLREVRVFPSDPMPPASETTLAEFTPIETSAASVTTAYPEAVRPEPSGADFQVKMVYDDVSFTLMNQSSHDLDLSRLRIVSEVIDFSRGAQWLGRYSDKPLSAFPNRWCMQVWSYRVYSGPPELPDECTTLASGRSLLNPGDRFWLTYRFEIYYGRQLVVTCFRDDLQCGFDVPQR